MARLHASGCAGARKTSACFYALQTAADAAEEAIRLHDLRSEAAVVMNRQKEIDARAALAAVAATAAAKASKDNCESKWLWVVSGFSCFSRQ